MAKTSSLPLITDIPLTSEAREQFLQSLFSDELPHSGELFIPDDVFYITGTQHHQANHMLTMLCTWLGIKPGYIGLQFETDEQEVPDGQRHTIYLETDVLSDEFVLGAFLAFSLCRYLLEQRKQVRISEIEQQDALVSTSTIVFGLGIVVINGISPAYDKWHFYKQRRNLLLKNFPLPNYTYMLQNFLKHKHISLNSYEHTVTPWASKRLDLPKSKQTTHVIHDLRHRIWVNNTKLAGVIWTVCMISIIILFALIVRVKPVPAHIQSQDEQAQLLRSLHQICTDTVAYETHYSDQSDLQTARALAAEQARCESLQNQLDDVEQRLRNEK